MKIQIEKTTLEQALEALKAMQSYAAAERKGLRICDEAITKCEEALAQPPLPVQPAAKAQDAKDAANEAAAKALYKTWHSLPGYVPWQDGGNSLMQDKARKLVRLAAHNIGEMK